MGITNIATTKREGVQGHADFNEVGEAVAADAVDVSVSLIADGRGESRTGGKRHRDDKRPRVQFGDGGDREGDRHHERGDGVVGEDLGEDHSAEVNAREEYKGLVRAGDEMIDASDEVVGQPRSGTGGLHRGAESEHTEDHEQQWPLDRFVGLFGLEAAGETDQHRAADRPNLNREPVERLAEHHGDNRGEHDRHPAMQRPRGAADC